MNDDLRTALDARDWPRALRKAIAAWREYRAPELADLIDRIAARVTQAAPPPKSKQLQPWWGHRAAAYTIDDVTQLLAHVHDRVGHSDVAFDVVLERYGEAHEQPGGRFVAELLTSAASHVAPPSHLNAIERLAAIANWPDDPRAASVLARWFVDAPVRWDPLAYPRATVAYYRTLAERLIQLVDTRVLPALEACVEHPRGPTQTIRALQVDLGARAISALRAWHRDLPPELAQLCHALDAPAAPPGVTPQLDEAELWRQCAARRDSLEPRLVLADLLAGRGDPRGELIALQCDGNPRAVAKAGKLVRAHWDTWLGDLALVLNRRGTEFRGGMLEVVRVGRPKTPEWAFTRVHGHRELGTVHTVRPGHVYPHHYAAFLAGLERIDRVAFDAPEIADFLPAHRPRWSIAALDYTHDSVRDPYRYDFPPLARVFEAIAATMPDLVEIRFGSLLYPDTAHAQLAALLGQLPSLFRRLQRIVFDAEFGDLPEAIRRAPLVTTAP